MQKPILVLNGPNLNLLGSREPEIYGDISLSQIEEMCKLEAKRHKINIDFRQSNHEGVLIDALHVGNKLARGIIFNPAGFSHTSVAILDAIRSIQVPVIEVHLSNLYKREEFRHKSITAAGCIGMISGFGYYGYLMAINYLVSQK